ncbi:hypothetical protein VV089_24115 [Candidatus Merdisoma sp. JLR.KK011]|uniref:hypothetical protein n=1 Tax=Candidatus Merdisoma sp. JLR.KK011 TaxID=3114299 RepID=UPI002FEF7A3F
MKQTIRKLKTLIEKIDKEKAWRWFSVIWLAAVPFLCCLAYCLKTDNLISDLYLPAGLWNDDIIYYKEVEGIVHYGIPQGYFGYSDTHARAGSFSVWSPVLLLPWSIWGLLFGWNYMSPIWCNIAMMMLGMGFFAFLAKPDKKQVFWLSMFYALFIRLTRYALSAHVESTVYFMVMLLMAFVFYLRREDAKQKPALAAMIVTAMILTWMRPYYIIFLAVPGYYLVKKSRKNGWLIAALTLVTMGVYFLISKYLCAPYLDGGTLFDTEFITRFFTHGILSGTKNVLYILLAGCDEFMKYLGSAIATGHSMGENAGISFAIVFVGFVYKLVTAVRQKDKETTLRYGYWTSFFVIMFLAIIFIFRISSGQKHLLGFTVIGIILLAMDGLSEGKMWMIALMYSYLFVMMTLDSTSWDIPYDPEGAVAAELQKGEEALFKEIQVKEEGPSYDNTVIWVFDDVVNEEYVFSRWQMLYALPPGMGINMCLFDKIESDFSNIQSKYIFTVPNGRTERHLQEIDAKKIAEYGNSVVYQIRE